MLQIFSLSSRSLVLRRRTVVRLSAFTFLELLIALALFSVGMVSVLRIFPANRKFLTQSSMTTQASFIAQEAVEAVRGDTYGNLVILPAVYEASHTVGTGAVGDLRNAFVRKTEMSYIDPANNWQPPIPTTTDTGMKKVVVTVSWAESGITRTYILTTYVNGI